MVKVVDLQVGDVTHPSPHLGAQSFPEFKITIGTGRSQPHAMQAGNAGVAARKISPAAVTGPYHQIDVVAGAVFSQQCGPDMAAMTRIRRRARHDKIAIPQQLFDLIKRRLTPDLDAGAGSAIRIVAEADGSKPVI
jgi:hypothetical protein